jgi:hypothetical protein
MVEIASIYQVAAAKDAIITVSFSLPLPLTTGKNINIWIPANFIEKINPVFPLHLSVAFP